MRLLKQNTLLTVLLGICCQALAQQATAPSTQKGFTGTVIYSLQVTGEETAAYKQLLPQKLTITFTGNGAESLASGSKITQSNRHLLFLADSGATYLLNDSQHIAYRMPSATDKNKITPLPDKMVILKKRCSGYKIAVQPKGQDKSDLTVWVAEGMRLAWPADKIFTGLYGCKGLKGLPLKLSTTPYPNLGLTVTYLATELKPSTEPVELGLLNGYEVKPYDPNLFIVTEYK